MSMVVAWAAPAAADPGQTGRWSAVQEYPVVPISAAVTTDGKIVAWDQADPGLPHSLAPNNGKAMILDPKTGAIVRSANLAPASVFCPLITTLPDGKVVIAGGGNDSTDSDLVQVYDPKTKMFGAWSRMSVGRWYGGGNITKTGDVVTLGGRGGSGADVVDAETGKTRRLDVDFGADWYPMAIRMPDGRFTIENVTDLRTSGTPSRQILDVTGAGALTGADDLTLLQERKRMTATMVGPYTMLGITGGTSKAAYLLDVGADGRPVPHATGSTKAPHITGTAVTLPDGAALVVGGNSTGSETYGTAVYATERWSPATGQWSSMASSPRQRQYHSVSALLPDGRVWSAGTSINGSGVNEYNGAYFTPPYLYKQDGSGELAARPQITGAPDAAAWGETMTFRSPQAASIRKASLVRLSATTHQYDFAGTYVPLDVSVSGDEVSVTVPDNGNTVPAGPYMVFLLDSAGVPSKAAIVRIDPAADATPYANAMQSTQDGGAAAWKGNDGDGASAGPKTEVEDDPWWQLDLGRSRAITDVAIAGAGALGSAWVFASDEPFTSTSVSDTRAQEGVTAVQLGAAPGATATVGLHRTARYLRVQRPGHGALTFNEITPSFGAAPAPKLVLTRVSETDTTVVAKVRNAGSGDGAVTSVSLPGAGWSGPTAGFTVAAGAETTITLARGTADGDLVVRPAGSAALRLSLDGTPPAAGAASTVPDAAAGGWQLNGSAAVAGRALRLTPNATEQTGTAFWPTALDTTRELTIAFDATVEGGTGADGMAMILADPSHGATPSSIGTGGGALGFGGIPGVAVTLSTYPESTVGISDGPKSGAWQTLNWLGTSTLIAPLQDTTHRVRVVLSGGTLTATIDGRTVTRAVSVPDRVLLGFSAATGTMTNRHEVSDLMVTGGLVDTTPPDAPTVASGPSSPTNATSASIAFTGAEAGGTFRCRVDTGAWGACTSPFAITGLAEGAHTFAVRHTDDAGNESVAGTHAWTVDLSAPETTIDAGPTGTTASASGSVSFTSEPDATFTCRLDGGTWESCTSPRALTGLADGAHAFEVRAHDAAGNTGLSATRTWTVHTAPPPADPAPTPEPERQPVPPPATTTTPAPPPPAPDERATPQPLATPRPKPDPARTLARLRGATLIAPASGTTTTADVGMKAPGINLRTKRVSMGQLTATARIRVSVSYRARLANARAIELGRRSLVLRPGQTGALGAALRGRLGDARRVKVTMTLRVVGPDGKPASLTRTRTLAVVTPRN